MTNEQKLDVLIKEVSEIKAMLSSKQPIPQYAPQTGEVADDDLLNRPWADMEIRKDPPRSSQPSSVGKRMSECTPEYLGDYASFHDWKAKKGREEDPPRLNNKGKPWYEGDELVAKVARGWAARARNRGAAPAATRTAKPKPMAFDEMPYGADPLLDDPPF